MKIVVCCCTRFFGEGLKLILERGVPNAASIRYCSDPRELFRGKPDLVIVDHAALPALTAEAFANSGCKALLLGTSCAPALERTRLAALVSLGLVGVVNATTDAATFSKSVSAALAGELWLSSAQVRDLLQAPAASGAGDAIVLTVREREIVSLLCRGLRNKAIMAELRISEQAVKSHLSRIGRKFGVTDRLQIVLGALKRWPQLLQQEQNLG